MATTTSSTPSGAAPKATPKLSLEEELRKEFTAVVADIETTQFEGKFRLDHRDETIDAYFTTVFPYHAQPQLAVRQFVAQQGGYLNQFLSEGWKEKEKDFYDEGRETAQLFFERFPVVQSHLPLRYSKRWAEDRLGDLRAYLRNKRDAPKDWDQPKAREELVNGFTDDKNIKRYHNQHRGRQKLLRGIGITAASAALLSMGLYFHNREGKVDELEGRVSDLDQNVLRLKDANAELDAHRLKAENERDGLKGTVNALNAHYDALDVSDVTAIRRAVCQYLATVSGEIVFRYTPDSPALNQLFAAMVGSSSGRDPKEYDARRARFVDRMKPVFPLQDPAGTHYQFFVDDTCPR